jgi:hypothetical protein
VADRSRGWSEQQQLDSTGDRTARHADHRQLVRLSSSISLRRAILVDDLRASFREATERFNGAAGLDLAYGGRRAIALFDRPSATSAKTSRCRVVMGLGLSADWAAN